MIDNITNMTPAGQASTTTEAGKAEAAQKLAALTREKGPDLNRQAMADETGQAKNLELETFDKLQKDFERMMASRDTTVEYTHDDKTNRLVFKVVDKSTGDTVRQFPPEELLNFAYRLIDFLNGKVVNEKA